MIIDGQPVLKTCRTCGVTKNISEFYRNSSSPDGHRASCKACHDRARGTGTSSPTNSIIPAGNGKSYEEMVQVVQMVHGGGGEDTETQISETSSNEMAFCQRCGDLDYLFVLRHKGKTQLVCNKCTLYFI